MDEWGGIWTQNTHNPPERERKRARREREKIHQPDLARRKPMKQKTKPQMALKNLQMLQDHRI
jgi:hypothetical protein